MFFRGWSFIISNSSCLGICASEYKMHPAYPAEYFPDIYWEVKVLMYQIESCTLMFKAVPRTYGPIPISQGTNYIIISRPSKSSFVNTVP